MDLKLLRTLAERATPGPWTIECRNLKYWNKDDTHKTAAECFELWSPEDGCDDGHLGADIKELPEPDRASFYVIDALYIAAANPQTIIALLDRIEELEKKDE